MDTLREENVKLKAGLSIAEQELDIRKTVEREHRVSHRQVREEPPSLPPLKPKSTRKAKVDVGEGPSKPPPSKKKAPPPEPETESEEVQEAPKPKSRPKPVKKQPSKDVGELAEGDSRRLRGKKPTEEDVEKPRPKPKPKKKAPVQEATEDSDVDVETPEAGPSKRKGKGRAKSTAPQESISAVPKKRGRPKAPTEEDDQPPKKKSATKKAAGRSIPAPQRRSEEDETEEEAKVKKKRKLKIFNSSQPSTFTWTFGADSKVRGGRSSSSHPFLCAELIGDSDDERARYSDRAESYEGGRTYDSQVDIFFKDKFFVYQMTFFLLRFECCFRSKLLSSAILFIYTYVTADCFWYNLICLNLRPRS